MDFFDNEQRRKSIAILSWVFPFIWAFIFIFIKLPVAMVLAGGIITSVILLLVIWVIIHLRYKRLIEQFRPKLIYDILLWVSIASTLAIAMYGIIQIWR
jgi:hypothetical protein